MLAIWTSHMQPTLTKYGYKVPQDIEDAVANRDRIRREFARMTSDAAALNGLVEKVTAGNEPTAKEWTEYSLLADKRRVYSRAVEASDNLAEGVLARHKNQMLDHLREHAFTPAVELLRQVADRVTGHDTIEGLLNAGRDDDARQLAAAHTAVKTIRDCYTFRGYTHQPIAVSTQATTRWHDNAEDLLDRPSKPSLEQLIDGIRDGWEPWLPGPEEHQAELDARTNAIAAAYKAREKELRARFASTL